MARNQDFITIARAEARKLWDAYHALRALQTEWNALDYLNTLGDGEGANAGYTRTEVGSVVFDTTDAIKAVLDGGHATNLAKLL